MAKFEMSVMPTLSEVQALLRGEEVIFTHSGITGTGDVVSSKEPIICQGNHFTYAFDGAIVEAPDGSFRPGDYHTGQKISGYHCPLWASRFTLIVMGRGPKANQWRLKSVDAE